MSNLTRIASGDVVHSTDSILRWVSRVCTPRGPPEPVRPSAAPVAEEDKSSGVGESSGVADDVEVDDEADEDAAEDELDDERAKSVASCIALEALHVVDRICPGLVGLVIYVA